MASIKFSIVPTHELKVAIKRRLVDWADETTSEFIINLPGI